MKDRSHVDSPFSGKIVGILLAVALFSFGAIMVLAGWAPELRDRNVAGAHPFSTSALGYNGFVQLLQEQGYPAEVSRLERTLEDSDWGLLVLTLPQWGAAKALEDFEPQRTTLLVLPKWTGMTDPLNKTHQKDTRFMNARVLNDLLETIAIDAEIGRIDVPSETSTPFGSIALKPDVKMQVLRGDSLTPIVETQDGILLAWAPDADMYVLSDPDMINTFGLSQFENARFATQMIDFLRNDYDEPIVFDATLHGFVRSENLLQMIFDIPFIGATLTALAAAFLLGWAALIRFGPPVKEGRAIALGKQALADNSAGLITMARRETRIAPAYLHMIRRRVSRDIGAPKTLNETQLTALFDRLGPEEESGKHFTDMASGLRGPATSREDLMNKARELFRWRKGIIGRSMNERE
ncbi:DUF4350 domain-containing protein [Hyphomonas sp. UBA4494]|jgi:hypothetical protein|uniref:DUF4350 domain-containing protein n=1 Tax=Hyphomonas sp. UBA4494 TaxID=1946631 RepID=UPI0025C3107B|nr:DUF4350 domain-containing protein [Hyphomonas sp. UBA4494]